MPGAKIANVKENVGAFMQDSDDETIHVLHVGTNDVMDKEHNAVLVKRFREMIKKIKEKSSKLIISAVLPRFRGSSAFCNRAYNFNSDIKIICSEEEVEFVSFWDNFYNIQNLYVPDDLHLSDVGSARYGRLLNDAVIKFQARNEVGIAVGIVP
jgi:hypothetical protein